MPSRMKLETRKLRCLCVFFFVLCCYRMAGRSGSEDGRGWPASAQGTFVSCVLCLCLQEEAGQSDPEDEVSPVVCE